MSWRLSVLSDLTFLDEAETGEYSERELKGSHARRILADVKCQKWIGVSRKG